MDLHSSEFSRCEIISSNSSFKSFRSKTDNFCLRRHTSSGLLRYIPNTYSIHKVSSLKFAYFQGRLFRHITSPPPSPRRLVPSLGLGTTWVRQPRSGGCHHPTAATKCNVQPSQATANSVGGKACSSTKGGLLRYIPNTYSIHKVSSLKFAYFQGRLFRHRSLNYIYRNWIHL